MAPDDHRSRLRALPRRDQRGVPGAVPPGNRRRASRALAEHKKLADRVADAPAALRPAFVAYLERKAATCRPKTVSSLATRLAHFGRFLTEVDPDLTSLAGLDRRRHIEPWLNSLPSTINLTTGETITVADQAR